MFRMNQMVRHVKTGGEYKIIGTPHRFRIEATNQPAYAYTKSPVDKIWIRPQAEMEDGRFVWVTRA